MVPSRRGFRPFTGRTIRMELRSIMQFVGRINKHTTGFCARTGGSHNIAVIEFQLTRHCETCLIRTITRYGDIRLCSVCITCSRSGNLHTAGSQFSAQAIQTLRRGSSSICVELSTINCTITTVGHTARSGSGRSGFECTTMNNQGRISFRISATCTICGSIFCCIPRRFCTTRSTYCIRRSSLGLCLVFTVIDNRLTGYSKLTTPCSRIGGSSILEDGGGSRSHPDGCSSRSIERFGIDVAIRQLYISGIASTVGAIDTHPCRNAIRIHIRFGCNLTILDLYYMVCIVIRVITT